MRASDTKRICVLGAGTMGAGIAQRAAQSGFKVALRDISDELVKGGLKRISDTLDEGVRRKKVTEEQRASALASIEGTTDLRAAVEGAQLVIEAVFEDMEVKRKVLGEVDGLAGAGTVIVTNTSSLSVNGLAKGTGRQDRFAGLHFFYPAAINRLLEVIEGEGTSAATTDLLMDLGRVLGKVPIRCIDSPGFIVNRFFVPMLNEGCRLVDEGVGSVATVDAAGREAFGVEMGPFALMNATGIPIAYHSQCSLHDALGEAYATSPLLRRQFEANARWDVAGTVDPKGMEVARKRLLGCVFTVASQLIDGGVCKAEAADLGATVGLRWRAGPFAMMNSIGTREARYLAATWVQSLPPDVARILAPRSLEELAATNRPWPLPTVVVERDGPVAVIRISRPAAMNALNSDVLMDLERALDEVERHGVRVVVLTGEGNAFVAGADIREMVTKTPLEARQYTLLGHKVMRRIERMDTIVIAAINGYALGGGLELALACDIVLASEKARLGLPETGLGIHPGFGGTQRLPRLVGRAKAKELILTGDQLTAQEAERLGIVNHVHPPDRLLEEAMAMAAKIAAKAPVAVRLAKRAVNRGVETDLGTALDYEVESVSLCFASDDRVEGLKAFVERRKPDFKGK